MSLLRHVLVATLLAHSPLYCAGSAVVQVQLEIKVPEAAAYADLTRSLVEEWYPKINDALFGTGVPLPFPELQIVFETTIISDSGSGKTEIPAYAEQNTIHVNTPYVVRTAKVMPADYRGMMIHELTHVNQHYPEGSGPGWLAEGIADYVRHKYYEKDIRPKLQLDGKGRLKGFELKRNKGDFEKAGYKSGYTVTGAFLYWLEVRKDPGIVPALSKALRESRYKEDIFQQRCGVPVSALWHEFVEHSKS